MENSPINFHPRSEINEICHILDTFFKIKENPLQQINILVKNKFYVSDKTEQKGQDSSGDSPKNPC
jgi:hypothetical protein